MKRIALLLIVCALSRAQTTFAIEDVNLFDGTSFHPHVTVTVEADKIRSLFPAGSVPISEGTARIDGRGRTLMPGLIDSHVHLSAVWPEDALRQNLAFGVTTVIDMWTSQPPPVSPTPIKSIKELEAADSPKVASVLAAGTGASAPGGHPSHMAGPVLAARMPTLTSPEQADAFVAARVAEGSDFLKIIYDDAEAFGPKLPMLNRATVAALVEAAHRRGKLAIAHITSEQQARDVISAGVDGLAHLFVGETASPDFGKFAAEHHVFVIPTLSIQYSSCGMSDGASVLKDQAFAKAINAHFRDGLLQPLSGTKPSCEGTKQALRQLHDAGVPILAGTDAPGAGTTYGASLHWELEHFVDLGLTPAEALASATSIPATKFGMNDRGRIAPGMRADLLLVDGDASKDITTTRKIVGIWKRGVRFE